MIRYISAQYIGDADDNYTRGKTYPLAVKTRLFTKKVSVYQRHGYYDAMCPGSLRDYKDSDLFHLNWTNIKEDRHER